MRSRADATASAATPRAVSSAVTPSQPILSSLSRVMKKLVWLSGGRPMLAASALRKRRSERRTVVLRSPTAASASVVASISSISASTDSSPMMSMSHWVNWR